MAAKLTVHGRLSAGEVGELVGVSGTAVGQWARWGYVRASQSSEVPHVYSVEDVGEASVVAELLRRGISHSQIAAAIARLRPLGPWPLSAATLATTDEQPPRLVLYEDDGVRRAGDSSVLGPRGWQRTALAPDVRAVRVRLHRPL